MVYFDETAFLPQLLENLENSEGKSISEKAAMLAPKVYNSHRTSLSAKDMSDYPRYRQFLVDWGFTAPGSTVERPKLDMYTVNQMTAPGMRTLIYTWRSSGRIPDSLETVISLCTACGMDFEYIKDAVAEYCTESFEGKGLRKALLYGAARGFISFDELSLTTDENGTRFGLLEKYYEKSLSAYENHTDIPTSMEGGTVNFLVSAGECQSRKDFLELLEKPEIQNGFLCDKVELISMIEDCLDLRQRSELESRNALFERYGANGLRATYSKLLHGSRPGADWFRRFAECFRLTEEESTRMMVLLHLNNI